MSAIRSKTHLPVLDAARGIAALAVFGYHMQPYFGGLPWLRGSFLAVDLFFIMSGFVIARSYDNRLLERTLDLRSFTRVRVIRLYPLYLLACAIGLSYFAVKIVAGVPDAPSVPQLIAALPGTILLLPSPFSSAWGFTPFPFAPSAWSLSLEFWFNILYAAIVIRFGLFALASVAAVALVVLVHQAYVFGTLDLGWNIATTLGGAARFWFSFTMGVIIFRLHRAQWTLPPATMLFLLPVFGFVAIPASTISLGLVWIVVVFPVALVIGAAVRAQGVAALISDHLGRLSYGIYILHAPIVLFQTGVFKVLMGDTWVDHQAMIGWAIIATVLAASALATYAFDEPLRRALQPRRRIDAPPVATPVR